MRKIPLGLIAPALFLLLTKCGSEPKVDSLDVDRERTNAKIQTDGGGGCRGAADSPDNHDYCGVACPCAHGYGDCDNDAECLPGTKCVMDVGSFFGYTATRDVCMAVESTGPNQAGGGDCSDVENTIDNSHYCKESCPCAHGFGDCDNDDQCQQGTSCKMNIGAIFGYNATRDVCVADKSDGGGGCRGATDSPDNHDYCGVACPCAHGYGDCDNDAECQPGTKCVMDVGSFFGYTATRDVCMAVESTGPNQAGGGGCSDIENTIDNSHYCKESCPCAHGFGDCDNDDQCQQGTSCKMNIGAIFGYNATRDVCVADKATLPVASGCSNCLYVSPDGDDDEGDGSSAKPWKSLALVIPKLVPGNTLVLKDGVYQKSTTGLLDIDCANGAKNGTEEQPIIIRADNERQAWLLSDGSKEAFRMTDCRHWKIEGLRTQSKDASKSEGGRQTSVFSIISSSHIQVKRLLSSHGNRYFNQATVATRGSEHILFEECEAYHFNRHGFSIWKSHDVTLRRCYANSRAHGDLPDCQSAPTDPNIPRCSGNRHGGDEAFVFYQSSHSLVENSISQNKTMGFEVHGGETFDGLPGGQQNRFLGSISIEDHLGVEVDARKGGGGVAPATGNLFENVLVVRPIGPGIYLRSSTQSSLRNVTVFGSQKNQGLVADEIFDRPCSQISGGCSIFATNLLSFGNTGSGVNVVQQDDWLVTHTNSYGNGGRNYAQSETVEDLEGRIRESMSVEPAGMGLEQGQCLVYVPTGSTMKESGQDGEDIGANILYRYRDGELTDEPLWNPSSGAFPCGVVVPGLNDVAGDSCFDVHQLLNVQHNGCELPEGYGENIPVPR